MDSFAWILLFLMLGIISECLWTRTQESSEKREDGRENQGGWKVLEGERGLMSGSRGAALALRSTTSSVPAT